jgi:hypothetical protein
MASNARSVMSLLQGDGNDSARHRYGKAHASVYRGRTASSFRPSRHMPVLDEDTPESSPTHPYPGLNSPYSVEPVYFSNQWPRPQFGLEAGHFEPETFKMYISEATNDTNEPSMPLHMITRFPAHAARLHDMAVTTQQLTEMCPQLVPAMGWECRIGADGEQQLQPDCDIIYVEANLALASRIPKSCSLGIEISIAAKCDLSGYEKFSCRTKFFDGSAPPQEFSKAIIPEHKYPLKNVSFGSHFWARKVMDLAGKVREATRLSEVVTSKKDLCARLYKEQLEVEAKRQTALMASAEANLRQIEHEINQAVGRLSAMQDIYAVPYGGYKEERVLTIFWNFAQCLTSDIGTATWRNIILIPAAASTPKKEEDCARPLVDDYYSSTSASLGPHHSILADCSLSAQSLDNIEAFSMPSFSTMTVDNISAPGTGTIYGPSVTCETSSVDFMQSHLPLAVEPVSALFANDNSGIHAGSFFNSHHDSTLDNVHQWGSYAAATYYNEFEGGHSSSVIPMDPAVSRISHLDMNLALSQSMEATAHTSTISQLSPSHG